MLKKIKTLIEALIITLATVIMLLVISLLAGQVKADVITLDDVKIQYKSFFEGGSSPLITQNGLPNKTLGKELNLLMDSSVFDVFYFNNVVHSMTDEDITTGTGQFRTVSWAFDFGLRVTPYLNMGFSHRSEHLLDAIYSQGRWPVQDAVMIELILFGKNKHNSLLNF